MKARRLVCAALIVALVVLAIPAVAIADDGWWAYTGTVVDADTGDPLPYAFVSLKQQIAGVDPEIYATVTDENGEFRIPPYFDSGPWGTFLYEVSTYVVVSRVGWDYTKSGASRWYWEEIDLGTLELQRDPAVIPHQVIFGQNRFDTSGRISNAMWPEGLDEAPGVLTQGTVVVASGQSWPDALVAASVAGVENAPVLLAGYNYYGYWGYEPGYDLISEVRRLKPERAIIIGGDDAVPVDIERELNVWVGADDVTRLAGDTRFETALLAADYVVNHSAGTMALVGSGYSFADALAVSPISWSEQMPLYLAGRNGITQSTLDAMTANGITDVMILGGIKAVSASVEASLVAEFGVGSVDRTGGSDRYETSVMLAQWGIDNYGFDYSNVAITSGQRFPDALSGGPYQGKTGSVMLLTRTYGLEGVIETALLDNAGDIDEVRFFGGPAAVANSVRREVDLLLR